MSDGEFLMRCESPVEPPKIRVKFEGKVVLPWSSALEAAYEMAGGHHSDLRVKHVVRATALPALCQALWRAIASRRRLRTITTAPTARAGASRARLLGSGTSESDPEYDPVIDSVVVLVLVSVAVSVASPVSPANNPVPPVITKSTVTVAVPRPLAVPLPEVVPNRVPWEKISKSIPCAMVMAGGLLKSMSDCDCAVKEPKIVSSPSPVKVWTKTPTGLVGVSVESPSKVPEICPPWIGTTRPPMTTRATKVAVIGRLIAKPLS
jgi:hypothetical protein